MAAHHTQAIANVAHYFQREPGVLALIVGGSLAHGFATAVSDVDRSA